MKVRALPTCRKPVGDGAKRTRSITFEYNGIKFSALAVPVSIEAGLAPVSGSQALLRRGQPRLYGKSDRLLSGYEGNSPSENCCSSLASDKKILLKTPCPGRN